MELLTEYAGRLREVLYMTVLGTATPHHAAAMIAMAGARGAGELRHRSLSMEGGMLVSVGQVELGERTTATVRMREANGTSYQIVQTGRRLYVVSEHAHREPVLVLSAGEVRLVGPVEEGCAVLVRMAGSSYEVVQEGELRCTKGLERGASTLGVGQVVDLGLGDVCSNRCVSMAVGGDGHGRGKEMPVLPSMHPRSISRDQQEDEQQSKPFAGWVESRAKEHHTMHERIKANVKESKRIIDDIREDLEQKEQDRWQDMVPGMLGVALSLVLALTLVFLGLRYKRSACGRGNREGEGGGGVGAAHPHLPGGPPASTQRYLLKKVFI